MRWLVTLLAFVSVIAAMKSVVRRARTVTLCATLLLMSSPSAFAGPDVDRILRNARRRYTDRLAGLVGREAGELSLERRLVLARILEVDPGHEWAGKRMGDRKLAVGESNVLLPTRLSEQLVKLELEFIDDCVRLCKKYAAADRRSALLRPCLELRPDHQPLHAAMGHQQAGGRYVRPEFAAFAAALPGRLRAWRDLSKAEPGDKPEAGKIDVPGVGAVATRTEWGRCAGAVAPKVDLHEFLAGAAHAHRFIRAVFGPAVSQLRPKCVLMLDTESRKKFVLAAYPAEEHKARMRVGAYRRPEFLALSASSTARALDLYAGMLGQNVALRHGAPLRPGTKYRNKAIHAWLRQGIASLVSFETVGTGRTSFFSARASMAQKDASAAPPFTKRRAECLVWLRKRLQRRQALSMQDVFSRSVNNLGADAAIQSYSFLRFLFLYDPKSPRRFLIALRGDTAGAPGERVERALKASCGAGITEMESKWRAFAMNLDPDAW